MKPLTNLKCLGSMKTPYVERRVMRIKSCLLEEVV